VMSVIRLKRRINVVCGKFQPDAVRNSVSLIIVKWVQCDKCEHLMFCTDVRVVRTGSECLCVHCK